MTEDSTKSSEPSGGDLSPVERFMSLFTRMRPGEGPSVLLYALYAFLLLVCYYILKTIREALILTEFGAEARSYATAVIAVLLLFVVPLYGLLFRHVRKIHLIRWVTLFFIINILIFWVMAQTGVEIGFFYFVFAGIFGVMVIAQFWAFAADSYNVKSGQRLFPVIMIGASAGALAGAQFTKYLTGQGLVEPINMLLYAAAILGATLLLAEWSRRSIPEESRSLHDDEEIGKTASGEEKSSLFGGFNLVFKDRYLLMIAGLVILLNWVNTTGETILAHFVSEYATRLAAETPSLEKGDIIARFYGDFFFWVNLVGFSVQAFLVARIYRWLGVSGALLILPAIAAVGYGVMAFIPIFSIIRFVKIMENSTDYSIMNTTRQALFLPTDRAVKYEGKTAIDTFFWRFGDLVQAGAFFVGIHYLGLSIPQFALVNLALAVVWFALAVMIGREYRRLVRENVANQAPILNRPIPDIETGPNGAFHATLAADTFVDADPGDVLTLSAQLPGGEPLPSWVSFHANTRTFRGKVPSSNQTEIEIEVVARDFDGLSASGSFLIRHLELKAQTD